MKTVILQKLTSRKFWALIASVVVCTCVIFQTDTATAERIVALIMAVGSVITYTFANVTQKKSEIECGCKKDKKEGK